MLQERAQSQARRAGAEAASLKSANAQLEAQLQQASRSDALAQQQEESEAAQHHLLADLQEQQATCTALTSQARCSSSAVEVSIF